MSIESLDITLHFFSYYFWGAIKTFYQHIEILTATRSLRVWGILGSNVQIKAMHYML